MISLLLALALATAPCRADGHNRRRSTAAKTAFRHAQPCPGGIDKGSEKRCRGYVIDHVCPLECCGQDAPENMQWQTKADGEAKDRWEGNCSTCSLLGLPRTR